MSSSISFNIYVMSLSRYDNIMTKNLLEYCTYVVRENEAEQYRAAGIEDMLVIPHGAVRGFMQTLYWIIENTPEKVIFIADDDIIKFGYRLDNARWLEDDEGNPDKETITAEIERIAQLLYDLNLGLAFDTINLAPFAYDKEFHFKGTPGHMRWINKEAFKAKLDMNDPAKSDIDMMMQELLYNRIILRPVYFIDRAYMDVNEGAAIDRQYHLNIVDALQTKWGKYYGYDHRKNQPKIRVAR